MFDKAIVRGFMAVIVVASAITAQADVFNMGGTRNPTTGTWTGLASLDIVTVGNPGNAADTATGYGSVGYTYQMGKYDVTAGQYTAFLNAVAADGHVWAVQLRHGGGWRRWRQTAAAGSSRAVARAVTPTRLPRLTRTFR